MALRDAERIKFILCADTDDVPAVGAVQDPTLVLDAEADILYLYANGEKKTVVDFSPP